MDKLPSFWSQDHTLDLIVESYASSAITFTVGGYSESEQIIAAHTTNSDRSIAITVIPITAVPKSLTLFSTTTSIKRGQCFVKVSLRMDGVKVAKLIQGYLSDTTPLAYPTGALESSVSGRGNIRSITGTNPAAGVEISETVPTGAIWQLKSFSAVLVADATVATREAHLIFDDGSNLLTEIPVSATHTASGSFKYVTSIVSSATASSGLRLLPYLEDHNLLLEGYRIRTSTALLQAGDNWGAPQLLVEEWLVP